MDLPHSDRYSVPRCESSKPRVDAQIVPKTGQTLAASAIGDALVVLYCEQD